MTSKLVLGAVEYEGIVAAAITGICALIGVIWQSRKTRRINTMEHDANSHKLDKIEVKIDRVDYRIDRVQDQLEDHLEEHRKPSVWDS
ncbi:MAG: hypothetical protein EBR30_21300 [Cytophagia bacterium]|nr:hypothetical protein [Cytophagia bacterium]